MAPAIIYLLVIATASEVSTRLAKAEVTERQNRELRGM